MKSQGLTAITIENFKGIGQAVTIPLRPVTLLFGANSFDTDNHVNNKTTWTRLSQRDCDDVLREFDPASSPHTLHHRFTLLQ